jgi:hypothetical protein
VALYGKRQCVSCNRCWSCGHTFACCAAETERCRPRIKVNFIDKKGKKIETMGKVGDSVLAVAHEHNIELEGS